MTAKSTRRIFDALEASSNSIRHLSASELFGKGEAVEWMQIYVTSANRRLLPLCSNDFFSIHHHRFSPFVRQPLGQAMPSRATKTAEEASGANKEALRGGVVGAAKVWKALCRLQMSISLPESAFSTFFAFRCVQTWSFLLMNPSGVSSAVALLLLASIFRRYTGI